MLLLIAGPAKAHAQNKAAPAPLGQVMTIGIDGSAPRLVWEMSGIQAPNWTPDGKWLICNGGGSLWRLAADGSAPPEKIPTGDVRNVNNDHVLSPDGQTIYLSAGGHLYAVPIAGNPSRIRSR